MAEEEAIGAHYERAIQQALVDLESSLEWIESGGDPKAHVKGRILQAQMELESIREMPNDEEDNYVLDPLLIYVAGPIATSGHMLNNIRAGVDAGRAISVRGHFPFIPHLQALWQLIYPREKEEWLQHDFEWLRQCHGLLRLPGESEGADREVREAEHYGLKVYNHLKEIPWLLETVEKRRRRK